MRDPWLSTWYSLALQVGAVRDLKREMGTRRASLQKQMLHELEQRIYVANIKVTWCPKLPGLEHRVLPAGPVLPQVVPCATSVRVAVMQAGP